MLKTSQFEAPPERGSKTKRTQDFRPGFSLSSLTAYLVATGGGAVGVVTIPPTIPPIPPPHELHELQELQELPLLQVLQVLQQVCWQQQSLPFFLRRPASAESGVRATQAQATTATIQILRSIRLPP
jgi:hypothetical protein